MSDRPEAAGSPRRPRATSLWVGVGLLFGLLALGWTILFMLTARNPVDTVPLEQSPAR